MNESYGKFICYKCKNSGIFPDGGIKTEGGYKEWLCRKEYIDGELQNKYVLYNHKDEKKWYCCCCCGETICGKAWRLLLTCKFLKLSKGTEFNCCQMVLFSILCLLFFTIYYTFYFLIFLWADLFNYCCGSVRKTNYFKVVKLEDFIIIKKIKLLSYEIKVKGPKIWEYGLSEDILNSKGPWICFYCKYSRNSFKDFIQGTNDLNTTIEVNNLKTEDSNLDNGIIAVLFQSADGHINYSIPCKKSLIFSEVEKKLLDVFPEYKQKRLIYIQNGNIIEKEKSLEDNKIIPGFSVVVNNMDE